MALDNLTEVYKGVRRIFYPLLLPGKAFPGLPGPHYNPLGGL